MGSCSPALKEITTTASQSRTTSSTTTTDDVTTLLWLLHNAAQEKRVRPCWLPEIRNQNENVERGHRGAGQTSRTDCSRVATSESRTGKQAKWTDADSPLPGKSPLQLYAGPDKYHAAGPAKLQQRLWWRLRRGCSADTATPTVPCDRQPTPRCWPRRC